MHTYACIYISSTQDNIYLNMPVLALMKTTIVMRWLGSITDSMDMNVSKLQESGVLQSMGSRSQTRLSD